MPKAKVAINGFGRIGRSTLRAILQNPSLDLNVVALNDLADPDDLAYLFKYDSVMGEFAGSVSATGNVIKVDGRSFEVLSEKDPAQLPWRSMGVDVVIESSGHFTDAQKARKHIDAGAKKVVISAPAKNEDVTINIGVNAGQYDPDKHHIISCASCTTNCLSVMAKVILDHFGIAGGMMTTIHSYTNSQALLDSTNTKDKRRGRAAAINIVPTTTGAARSIDKVLPPLKDRLDGYAIRVPTPDVSILDLTVRTEKPVSRDEANRVLREAAQNSLRGVLAYREDPLVSTDYIGDPHSCIIDGPLTMVTGGHTLKVVGWYDNEWGFSNRLAELTALVASRIPVAV